MLSLFIGCLVPISIGIYTDYKDQLLPDIITLPILLSGIVYASTNGTLKEAFIGAVIMFALYLFLALKGGVGGGDVKLAAGVGAWFGLFDAITIMLIASLLAIIAGLIKLAKLGLLKNKIKYWLNGIKVFFLYGVKTIKTKEIPEEGELPPEAIPFGIFMGIAVWGFALYLHKSAIALCLLKGEFL